MAKGNVVKKLGRLFFIYRKIKNYKGINGWLTENEAIGLYTIANKLNENSKVVEIGSWQGKSTYCIAKGLKSGKIYAIDPFNADAGFDESSSAEYHTKKGDDDLACVFLDNIKKFNIDDKIVMKKGYSGDFHQDFSNINFLFIDGDHSIQGCNNDYEMYAHKVVKGGFIAFHDYYHDRPELGPTYVINEIIQKSNDFTFFNKYDSLWVGIKNN